MQGVRGIELGNPDWYPVAYDLSLVIDEAASSTSKFALRQRITVAKRLKTGGEEAQPYVNFHAGTELQILATSGASIHSRYPAGQLSMKLDSVEGDRQTFDLFIKGSYRTDMKGLYKSQFREDGSSADAPKRTLISTHFEPIAARHFFVCVDEPSIRCDFTLNVALIDVEEHKDFVVVSGGQQEGTQLIQSLAEVVGSWPADAIASYDFGGKDPTATKFTKWSFATVPQISTYLTVVVMGPMDFAEVSVASKAHGSIPMRYYIPKGTDKTKIQFALDVGKVAFEYFENFFAPTPYPLKKIDFAAIPQFSIGGEESFGLITTFTGVLLDPNRTAVAVKSRIAALVAHELSHNWFGDIVSIKFWSGLYLKEGFASYFGYDGAAQKYPEWEPMEDAMDGVFSALETDGFEGTHPLEQEILSEGAIVESFDAISYNKGQGLVFMLAAFLGPEKFQQGLSGYVAKYNGQSTTTPQLWEALEEATGVKISAVMNDYATKSGHPIVLVERDGDKLVLNQRRYRTIAALSQVPATAEGWTIPVTLTLLPKKDPKAAVVEESVLLAPSGPLSVNIKLPEGSALADYSVVANEDHTGFFRAHYPTQAMWFDVLANYQRMTLNRSRRGMVEDIFALFNSGDVSTEVIHKLMVVIAEAKETSLAVLSTYVPNVKRYLKLLPDAKRTPELIRTAYAPLIALVLDGTLGTATKDAEAANITKIRPLVWRSVLNAAESLFLQHSATFSQVASSSVPEGEDRRLLEAVQQFVRYDTIRYDTCDVHLSLSSFLDSPASCWSRLKPDACWI